MNPQMSPDIPKPLDPRPSLPLPFGISASDGTIRSPFQPPDPNKVVIEDAKIQEKGEQKKSFGIVPTAHGEILSEAGWCVVFASDADPAIIDALNPLILHRQSQVNDADRFKVFKGNEGVFKGQDAVSWLGSKGGIGLAPVVPEGGVPFHLLIVGPPSRIPFEFQYTLDLQWSVGRLDFDTPAEYAAYAQNVVNYETAATINQSKTAAMWMTANGDAATNMLCNDVGLPFFQKPLGLKQGFKLSSFFAAQATKAKLTDILSAPPAVLFTGSHGMEVTSGDAADQRERQGALVTQEFQLGMNGVPPTACFTGADVPSTAELNGMIHVMFACFGGGCPATDNYPDQGKPAKAIAPAPMVSRLPQRILAKGALAVIGHVDRTWNWTFQSGSGQPQNQVLRSIIEAIMLGFPVGMAMDFTNSQWGTFAAKLGIDMGPTAVAAPAPAALATLVIARDDARNLALFGDPAVRLRVDKMV